MGEVAEVLATHKPPKPKRTRAVEGKPGIALGSLPSPGSARVLGPMSALEMLTLLAQHKIRASVVMLDPWYRSKNGHGRAAYLAEMVPLLEAAARVGDHVMIWGFPESIARLVDHWPESLRFGGWITWWFKNAPSRGKTWRPSQQACLHLHRARARFYPEHFYSPRHREHAKNNRLEFKMTPFSVIEAGLLSGFIKRSEQTGYPAQKPESVMEPLLKMTTKPGDLVVDPTCGSGTTGAVATRFGCAALLSDRSAQAVKVSRLRLADPASKGKGSTNREVSR
ncbi:MAG: DNA methyltransferase [Panacagrimonas sp.]